MNSIGGLISYVICPLMCVSLFTKCGTNNPNRDCKIEYNGNNIDKISNIGCGKYEINFHNNKENKIYSFGYYKNDSIPDGIIVLFYENGNLNNLFHTEDGKRKGSSIFCDKEGEVLSLDNFKNDLKDGLQYTKLDSITYVISFFDKGVLVSKDTLRAKK